MTYKHLYSIVALASFLVILPSTSHAKSDSARDAEELRINTINQGYKREIQRVSISPSVNMNPSKNLRPENDVKKEKLEKEKQVGCDISTKRIDEKIVNYQKNHTEQTNKYQKLIVQLQDAISKLTTEGKDATKLSADLTQLKTMMAKLDADQKIFIDKLSATKAFPCGNSNGDYVTAVQAARDAQKTVITDAQNIRKFFEVTVRADIRSFKSAMEDEAKRPKPSISPYFKLRISPGVDIKNQRPVTRPVETPKAE